jgi:hypothetical protein
MSAPPAFSDIAKASNDVRVLYNQKISTLFQFFEKMKTDHRNPAPHQGFLPHQCLYVLFSFLESARASMD